MASESKEEGVPVAELLIRLCGWWVTVPDILSLQWFRDPSQMFPYGALFGAPEGWGHLAPASH